MGVMEGPWVGMVRGWAGSWERLVWMVERERGYEWDFQDAVLFL